MDTKILIGLVIVAVILLGVIIMHLKTTIGVLGSIKVDLDRISEANYQNGTKLVSALQSLNKINHEVKGISISMKNKKSQPNKKKTDSKKNVNKKVVNDTNEKKENENIKKGD